MSRAQEYRLRSFETAYVKPHLEFFEEHGGENWENLYFPLGWPEGTLRIFLLREASNWIRMGRQCGYFSPDLDPFPIGRISVTMSDRTLRSMGIDSSHLDPQRVHLLWSEDWQVVGGGESLGEELTLAMEDLTDDRREFLRLFFFSEETEWKEKMGELAAFTGAVDGFKPPFPGEIMDQVAWALQGPDSTLQEFRGFPSDWRARPLLGRREMTRAESLEGYRSSISTAVKWMIIGELPDETAKQELAEWVSTAAEQVAEEANGQITEEANDSNTGRIIGEKEDGNEKPKFRQMGGDDIDSS